MNETTKTIDEKAIETAVAELKAISTPLKDALVAVIEAAPIGNVIACYDHSGVVIDAEEVASEAADFVLKGLLGSFCYNVIDGHKGNGASMLNQALDQVDRFAERDATFRTEKSADQLQQRILWACRMDVQQSYRKSLQDFVTKLYTAVTGTRYVQRGVATGGRKPDSPEQSVAANLRASRQATS